MNKIYWDCPICDEENNSIPNQEDSCTACGTSYRAKTISRFTPLDSNITLLNEFKEQNSTLAVNLTQDEELQIQLTNKFDSIHIEIDRYQTTELITTLVSALRDME